MTNSNSVAHEVTEVEAADRARSAWDASVIDERAAWATGNMQTIRTAQVAQIAAHTTWKAAELALKDMWRVELDEEMRLEAMCAAHDAMGDEDYDEAEAEAAYMGGIGEAMSYLDHHYHQDSDGGYALLAAGGDSPYAR